MGSPAAQEGSRLIVDVGDCVDLVTPEERLACFDAQVERSRREVGSSAAAQPSAAAVSPESVRSSADAGAQVARGEQPRGDEAPLVVAKIAALRERVPNSYLITLDNGQVWRQLQSQRFALRVGSEVQIYPPPWGDALRLRVEGQRGFIQVAPVR